MGDLISREALYQALHEAGGCDAKKNSWDDGWDSAITEAIRLLEQQPTVDPVLAAGGCYCIDCDRHNYCPEEDMFEWGGISEERRFCGIGEKVQE